MNIEWIISNIKELKSVDWLISGIAIPLFSALFGAWFGAQMAAKLAGKTMRKNQLKMQISGIHTAALECSIACKDFISLKKQLVRPSYEAFVSERKRIIGILGTPTVNKTIDAELDLKVFHDAPRNIEGIVDQMVEVGAPPKTLLQIRAAAMAANTLAILNSERSAWIEEARTSSVPHKERIFVYFGIPGKDTFDTRYKDIMDGIWNSCEDCIFHTQAVVDALNKFNLALRKQYYREFGPRYRKNRELPQLTKFVLNDNMLREIPNSKNYSDWSNPPIIVEKKWWRSNIKHEEIFADNRELP
ncbi:MAG: hypothetical protein ACU0CA_07665 [Paracoccaceae bacterium]